MSNRDDERAGSFERDVVPHLDSAYNLARWLTGNDADAEDVVQDAAMRALRFVHGLRSPDDARAWLLQIVRNASYTWLGKTHRYVALPEDAGAPDPGPGPDELLHQEITAGQMRLAMERLAPEFREVLVLREIDEMSYEEVARVAGIPMGTVMSRLARARAHLRRQLLILAKGSLPHE